MARRRRLAAAVAVAAIAAFGCTDTQASPDPDSAQTQDAPTPDGPAEPEPEPEPTTPPAPEPADDEGKPDFHADENDPCMVELKDSPLSRGKYLEQCLGTNVFGIGEPFPISEDWTVTVHGYEPELASVTDPE